jgi:hydrogenase maturation protease
MTRVATTRPVQLLVCGNDDRCDDGAAIWATLDLLEGLPPAGLAEFGARQCGALDVEHLLEVPAGNLVVIADAATGVRPGHVVTLTFDELIERPHGAAPHSSHTLPIDQVIGIARELSDEPIDGLFVGIGARDLGFSQKLSGPVRESMGEFVVAIERALMRLASASAATGRT